MPNDVLGAPGPLHCSEADADLHVRHEAEDVEGVRRAEERRARLQRARGRTVLDGLDGAETTPTEARAANAS